MHDADLLNTAGLACQVVGLAFAGGGLWRSWRANIRDEHFWPEWIRHPVRTLAAGREGRPVPLVVPLSVSLRASVTAPVIRAPRNNVDQRLDHLEEQVDGLHGEMSRLRQDHERLERAFGDELARVHMAIGQTSAGLERKIKAGTVLDLRPAAVGATLAGIGAVLELVSSALA